MTGPNGNPEDQKTRIISQTAELSRLLGMIPADSSIEVKVPETRDCITLKDWLSETRNSFLKLSLLMSKALNIQLQ